MAELFDKSRTPRGHIRDKCIFRGPLHISDWSRPLRRVTLRGSPTCGDNFVELQLSMDEARELVRDLSEWLAKYPP